MSADDVIADALDSWDRADLRPGCRGYMTVVDRSPEPRPQGRYLLCTWDGKERRARLYPSMLRRWIALRRFLFSTPIVPPTTTKEP